MTDKSENDSGPSHFRTTAWSVVARAQDRDDEHYQQSLALLCNNYWKPIYYYLRRRGVLHNEALDVTQDYFATFLEKSFVDAADRERGKFRTFMLTTVSRFLSKHRKREARGGRKVPLTIKMDMDDDEILHPDLSDDRTPEDEFNRSWARSLVARALVRMRETCTDGKRKRYAEVFEAYLESATDVEPLNYRDLGQELGLTESDMTNYLHRGRNIFQKMLREEIRDSVMSESEIDEEIEALRRFFG